MSWLKTIVEHVDYLRGRYEAFPVHDEVTRAGVLQVLDEVRRKELKRVHGRSALETAAFVDADVRYELYAVKDKQKDQVIGCVRVTKADEIAAIPESRKEYHLDKFPPALLARTQVFTRLAILQAYRKTAASLVLLRQLWDDAMAGNILAALLSCEPGLYAGYLRLGFRPLGGVHKGASGGFRIPMVAILHDREYVRRIRSPMLPQLAPDRRSAAAGGGGVVSDARGPRGSDRSRRGLLCGRFRPRRARRADPGTEQRRVARSCCATRWRSGAAPATWY